MKKILLFFASLFIGIGLLVWVFRFIDWEEIKLALLIFSGWQGIIILLLTGLILFIGMWKWKVILKSQGYNLSNQKLIGPYFAYFSISYLFPVVFFGGEIFRVYILKEKFSIPWKKGITSVIIDRILEATLFLITIFAGLAFFLLKTGFPPKNLGIILAVVLIFFSAGIGFFYFESFKRKSIIRFFINFFNHKRFLNQEPLDVEKEIFNFFRLKKRATWNGFGLTLLKVVITWLRCWVLLLFLGKSVGVLPALSILGFYYFALMIPIPAALGSHEIVQVFTFGTLGLGAGVAPAFTMIQRGAELILALIGIITFFKLGVGLLRTVLFSKIENLMGNRNNHI
ncbi:MAG: hypothetical protein CO031_01995 [Candidatus Nealsonbacteria bacterium CG_4_9_14_0_2_um_filter_37_38]|uniref:Flippase-like domain-containing protein n=1 Tax=Candidatus Nealsonbacteria bacterium CG_4_10_14_0_8_um_filter_37_14 TaxID=1974684 RepID=A0A2M7R6J2_9BACT|nr:MAG: hypothetical protein COV63_03380 [Candidatus Nealsonbacteria bacterium CG11_big_fil_rev_8_21_14_0_20_37_68]PIW92059.1 MAG: hypothetical protein COZ89_01995 [Candidatus Nealsonbacteria bacterium CG_4_8_14_3_um_filter_37_23]PIY88914.1 MAG: hypothetical protein COY73_02585 [Candidatus Nealsonbacteria bacterium CG_4_10_14_0_8_um_filter_37_14]PJC51583.1 MAG: hypothetical protein CO031_01995 [Candidatus Nealsonbacteria bacterium CG_4_9_14_0_2_um_filter_37_38]